jgi:hypothetical protein
MFFLPSQGRCPKGGGVFLSEKNIPLKGGKKLLMNAFFLPF